MSGKNEREDDIIANLPSAAPLRAATIGYAPSTSRRNPELTAWLREVSKETHVSRRDKE